MQDRAAANDGSGPGLLMTCGRRQPAIVRHLCRSNGTSEVGRDGGSTVTMGWRGIVLILGLVSLAAGCRDTSAVAPPPPPVVKVEPVIEKDVPITAEWVGTLVGYINAQIRARVSGHLMSQNYTEGSLVKTGDLLFQVDPRPFQTAARSGRGQAQPGGVAAEPGQGPGQRESGAGRAGDREGGPGRGPGQAGGGHPAADGARRRRYTPLAQRGSVSQQELDNAVQSNLANLAAVAAARAAVLNSQASVSQSRGRARKVARRREDAGSQHRRGARRAGGGPAQSRLHAGAVADRGRRRDSAARTSATTSARAIPRR